ncbi:MAG: peptidase [Chloroflexi bacterium RBG_19FT_COMBO_55_16]|nr:MAG: peptidase [Chloroflexi bacterium RBG_19FT_COMBO_55_16]
MSQTRIAPYGSWKSPITSDLIVSETIGLGAISPDGVDIYWIEVRLKEGGRYVVVRRTPDGKATDITPPPFNVRTRVHEYGGAAYKVLDGVVFFANFDDQRIYRQDPGQDPGPITPEGEYRYADLILDHRRNRLICVREDHTRSDQEAVNTLVSVDLKPGNISQNTGQVLVSGNDFYAFPRLNPGGTQLAWTTWNHPNMPWDGTELWVADLVKNGLVSNARLVTGGIEESIFQPSWSPNGVLHFISDRSGWWNLYCWRDGKIEPIYPMEAEFGMPQWVFGMSSYEFASAERLVCTYIQQGTSSLAILDLKNKKLTTIDGPFTDIWGLRVVGDQAIFNAGSPTESAAIINLDLTTGFPEVLRRSSEMVIDPAFLSYPQTIEFPTENGLTAFAFFFPPKNPDFSPPTDELPPLLVMSHGGPTGATSTVLSSEIQYWTSRGIAVLDVNYGGSTGYGRKYRERLNGHWGLVDMDDCANGARFLVKQGIVDGNRLAITGGSAGGYTTLCALTFRDLFKAGASHFGIGDLESFVKDTHKFESRYLDRLVGPFPERRDLYRERSPIQHIDQLSTPMILFQGLEDKIVPPNQAEMMFSAVRAKGLPVAYLPFEGEQHGFRKAENIKRALDAELYFYSRIFGFELADPVEPVHIENL